MNIKSLVVICAFVAPVTTTAAMANDRQPYPNENGRPGRHHGRLSSEFSVLATDQLRGGTRERWTRTTLDLGDVRGLDQLQFAFVNGITAIEDVLVTYADGRTATYHLGDSVTPAPRHQLTRVIDLDGEPVRSITVTGWGQQDAQFSVLGKAGHDRPD